MSPDTDAQKIWFSADYHFGHYKIVDICSRPTTPEEHDEWLLARINSVVGKNDTHYILGDISMKNRKFTEDILHRMHGNKILITGNHDESIKSSPIFKEVTQIKNFNFNSESFPNIHIVLCHYPIASWDRKTHGAMHLYGHCHGRFKNSGLSFDCGVDANNYFPLNLIEVFDKMTKISLDLF
jgi:calcineurin-like phosphoesterase family protein